MSKTDKEHLFFSLFNPMHIVNYLSIISDIDNLYMRYREYLCSLTIKQYVKL